MCVVFFFFFSSRRRHTRFDCDWSSDVCSSDLIATGLEPTVDPHTFFAPTVGVLVDSPLLVGRLRSWRFAVDGVPHRVVYWPLPDAAPFDTAALVCSIERPTPPAVAVFGGAPHPGYSFLPEDGAHG